MAAARPVAGASGATQHVPEATGDSEAGRSAAGGTGGASSNGGGAGSGGSPAPPLVIAKNYAVTGSWPNRPLALATRAGSLTYTKLELDDRFLAESCAIGDYDRDGLPDVSSGRRWYRQQRSSTGEVGFVAHVFRDGHDELPRTGDGVEIDTGVSDDRADYALDVDRDGYTDIINISNTDLYDVKNPSPMPKPQPHATAYWYKNPGVDVGATAANWNSYVLHDDVRGEQHGLGDVDGDGMPEIYGACRNCNPAETRGYYQANAEPTLPWSYHPVTGKVTFPFGGLGKLHGAGFGDVDGDGQLDLLERDGVWLGMKTQLTNAFYVGPADIDPTGAWGGSHMHASDLDGDGDADVVSADDAHHDGLSWYEQTEPGRFVRHRIMGHADERAELGVYFSQLHALELVDMDGDGVSDIVTGKTYLAQPWGYGDADPHGKPVLYVFRTLRQPRSDGSPLSFEPVLVDDESGIGQQIAIGHVDTDGVLDLCIASKLGLYVFFGH